MYGHCPICGKATEGVLHRCNQKVLDQIEQQYKQEEKVSDFDYEPNFTEKLQYGLRLLALDYNDDQSIAHCHRSIQY